MNISARTYETTLLSVGKRGVAPTLLEEVDVLLWKVPSHHSGLHINLRLSLSRCNLFLTTLQNTIICCVRAVGYCT
jgi:hypothetical protein